jgi:hypothetical protein
MYTQPFLFLEISFSLVKQRVSNKAGPIAVDVSAAGQAHRHCNGHFFSEPMTRGVRESSLRTRTAWKGRQSSAR